MERVVNQLRGQLPVPTPDYIPRAMLPKQTEKDVAGACDRLMHQAGWIVERLEQRRASKICEGLPDRRYVRVVSPGVCVRIWVELKAPKGKLTRDQYAWLVRENEAGGLATVIDSVDMLARVLGLLRSSVPAYEARRECLQLLTLTAQRGFRGEKKGDVFVTSP